MCSLCDKPEYSRNSAICKIDGDVWVVKAKCYCGPTVARISPTDMLEWLDSNASQYIELSKSEGDFPYRVEIESADIDCWGDSLRDAILGAMLESLRRQGAFEAAWAQMAESAA